MESSGCRKHKENTDQAACTPDYIYNALHAEFDFKFDPVPVNPTFDGLAIRWDNPSFVNPPYNQLPAWIEKGLDEMRRGVTSVFLIPFRPHRTFFHTLIEPNASEIRFLEDRVVFKGYKRPARFGVCIVVFRPTIARAMTNFSILRLPSPLIERSVERLRLAVQARWGISFDYVGSGTQDELASHTQWGSVSFICATRDIEGFIDRCEEISADTNVVVLVIPMRNADSSYFLKKVMFGRAKAVSVVSPPLVCDGYETPSPDASVVMLFAPGGPELKETPVFGISDIRRPRHLGSRSFT